ncbi:MAG TPA: peptidoglycan recognition family protein [Tepidisphaeraceae bacterium]|nr:peptidoglycan recognition family protein [Tepidisphaeraceae bacterium]
MTSALLLALAPAPLTPDASSSLFAVDQPESMDAIFQTQVAARAGRWKYIYIHHSRTASGNAMSLSRGSTGLGDHFVIGNGEGAIDGEIQIGQRWNQQLPADPPAGATGIDPACISVCLIGDFDHAMPTPTQIRRLGQLVNALQSRFDIPAGKVLMMPQSGGATGIGRHFPTTAFREQLLP